ncbi:MAG TPA: ABC transporter permease [bacterium]
MLKNYVKIALRNLIKQKSYSLINIAGLAIGLTCAILILLYVQFELSYDRFHDHADRLYRIAWMSGNPQTRTPHPMALAMAQDFPEVTEATTLSPIWGPGLTRPKLSVRYEDKRFDEPGFYSADSTFFKVFSFNLLRGDPERALKVPGGVVITEEIAKKYFGDEDPLNKILVLEHGQRFDMTVTGVMQNLPRNSHFHFDFLISYVTLKPLEDGSYYTWEDFGHYNYIVLAPGADPKQVEAKIPDWFQGYVNWPDEWYQSLKSGENRLALQPVTDIHLHSHLKWELEPNSDIAYIYIFSAAAIFILVIACVNFMNLATARSASRAKEVGLRKVVGAQRSALINQFLGESLLMTAGAMLISVALVELLLPSFNGLTDLQLELNVLENVPLFIALLAITLVVGVLAGSYPAFFLSGFQPIQVIAGKIHRGKQGASFRKILVVTQFAISIALIAAAAIVSAQLEYLRNNKLGFEPEQVLVIPMKDPSLRSQYESIKAELLRNPNVLRASAVSNVPGSRYNQNQIHWVGMEDDVDVSQARVDFDFLTTLKIKLKAGRDFSKEFATDVDHAFILNETAARQFNWDSPLEKEITWYDDDNTRVGKVIGVVEDFHFQSLHRGIEPLILHVLPEGFNSMLVKLNTTDLSAALNFIEQKWGAFDPGHTFEFTFLNEDFNQLYRSEEKMQSIVGYFTFLAIFIACLGLLGLASYSAERRTKEIGVRKVLGASVWGIVRLLSKEFLILVVLANVIAWPLAYWLMHDWLQDFAYRVTIGFGTFFLAGISAAVIALLTVATQAIRAALTNPVEALRYE